MRLLATAMLLLAAYCQLQRLTPLGLCPKPRWSSAPDPARALPLDPARASPLDPVPQRLHPLTPSRKGFADVLKKHMTPL
ncbi:MAG: hypothetical protein NC078_00130 [Ruminococcus sp.]|nr:hypothetical protein [Ruminococcus sp.]